MNEFLLTEAEIEFGKALTANIQSLQNNLIALAMTEQLYIDQLRQARKLDDRFGILNWESGFEIVEVGSGKQNN